MTLLHAFLCDNLLELLILQAAQISEDRHLFCEITDSLSTQTSVFDRIANGLAHFYDHMEAMRRHQRQE